MVGVASADKIWAWAPGVSGGERGHALISGNRPSSALLADMASANSGHFESVAASQTSQMLGATGAAGDFLARVVIVPASLSPGAVSVSDGATSVPLLPGGLNSVAVLVPIVVDLGLRAVAGGWRVTTGANVSVLAVGRFT